MSEENKTTGAGVQPEELSIPEEVQKKFPKLIELIKGSQSMDHEERQYWIDVLPIMTEDQISNLRGILENEKKQIEEANQEYEEGMEEETAKVKLHFDEIKYKEKKRMRLEAEKLSELEEREREKALLKELEGIY